MTHRVFKSLAAKLKPGASSPRWLRALSAALLVSVAGLGLSGCETAPATGRTIFTGGMDPQTELAIGRQQHPQMVNQFGGAYDDPELQRYVSSMGDYLAATSEQPDLDFTFARPVGPGQGRGRVGGRHGA